MANKIVEVKQETEIKSSNEFNEERSFDSSIKIMFPTEGNETSKVTMIVSDFKDGEINSFRVNFLSVEPKHYAGSSASYSTKKIELPTDEKSLMLIKDFIDKVIAEKEKHEWLKQFIKNKEGDK